MSTDTYRPMTPEQREALTEAAFKRLECARELHAANEVYREALERLQRANDAHENAVDKHSEIEGDIARGVSRGTRLASAVAS